MAQIRQSQCHFTAFKTTVVQHPKFTFHACERIFATTTFTAQWYIISREITCLFVWYPTSAKIQGDRRCICERDFCVRTLSPSFHWQCRSSRRSERRLRWALGPSLAERSPRWPSGVSAAQHWSLRKAVSVTLLQPHPYSSLHSLTNPSWTYVRLVRLYCFPAQHTNQSSGLLFPPQLDLVTPVWHCSLVICFTSFTILVPVALIQQAPVTICAHAIHASNQTRIWNAKMFAWLFFWVSMHANIEFDPKCINLFRFYV